MIACLRIARFELVVAAGGPEALAGRPLALAPARSADQRIGEVSGAAEAFGVRPGMTLSEALARCPELHLLAADPLAVEQAWETVAAALEGIGAAVELERPGLAYFDARGLRGLYGGYQGVLAVTRQAAGRAIHLGCAPTKLCALAAAQRARAGAPVLVRGGASQARDYLARAPVELLDQSAGTAGLTAVLRRLGVETLGELATLPRAAVVDRFGPTGMLAHGLACGGDVPLKPRRPPERLSEQIELEETASGVVLERALGALIDRLLARRERQSRTLRAVLLSATLNGGGSWHERVVFRQPLSRPDRIRLVLTTRLRLLPGPALTVNLSVIEFGPPASPRDSLLEEPASARRARLREAIHQVRAVAGPEGALRAVFVEPGARIPERRMALTPFEPESP